MGGSVLAGDPFAPDTLYADAFSLSGIAKSMDGGKTWSAAMTFSRSEVLEKIVVERNAPNRDSGGVSKSVDGGRHWTALLKDTDEEQVLIDPFGSGTVYAGSDFGGWRRSTNGGATWTTFVDGSIFRLALDPVVPDVLYASTFGGLSRSDDRGDTWHSLGNPLSFGTAWSIAIDPGQREVIVAGGGSSQVASRSVDEGKSWSPGQ